MNTLTRFFKYIKINTESNEDNYGKTPSSENQWKLAYVLADELKELGMADADVDRYCTVYGHFPATAGYEDCDSFGFIAHMDTVQNGSDISPRIIENYNGKDVLLDNGTMLEVSKNPELPSLVGRTLIVTDGRTILGADDKAGIAAIMRMCEIIAAGDIPHGKICVAFTPDEEIGAGVMRFDLDKFDADFAVTVDGGAENVIECENFNAASATVKVTGTEAHTGTAKGIMINAAKVLTKFISMLPENEVPEHTEGREGFFHLEDMKGGVTAAEADFLLRDFDKANLQNRKKVMIDICSLLNKEYGDEVISVEFKDTYSNMLEIVEKHPKLLKRIEAAIENIGMKPEYQPIRGGTDGCQLSYMGLPCPNIGAGGYGFHGVHEHCTLEGMENAAKIMIEIIKKGYC